MPPPRKSKARPARGRRLASALLLAGLVALLALAGYGLWLDQVIRAQFEGKRWALPARIYARPLELYPDLRLGAAELAEELERLGYQKTTRLERPGSYNRKDAGTVEVFLREFRFWDGSEPSRRVRLGFAGDRLQRVSGDGGAEIALVRLEPLEIGRIYPSHHEDRILVRLAEVPPALVQGLLAVEDRGFYEHWGLDPRGIARALWANVRAGGVVQGGSTLTQQLVKNYFLTQERTLWRKVNEALMALLLERRYGKDEILEAYLNEVYLGQQGPRAVHGFGLASEFYFGRPLKELRLHEIALLVGLARGPIQYNPRRAPARALERRNLVLDQMRDQGYVSAEQARTARASALGVRSDPGFANSPFPAFLDLVRRQLVRDYREEDLRSEGLQIFTTLAPPVQARAERALTQRLAAIERARRMTAGTLEGAVVVADPKTGEVLGLVGGRDPQRPGFNRALDAQRPIGSLVKPAVYLSALLPGEGFSAVSRLRDEPVRVKAAPGQVWSPQNYDRRTHGEVTVQTALARSYNLATVNLGLDVGLRKVARTLNGLGVTREIPPYPSVLLGALDLSPFETAQMYQTLAGLGFRIPLRAIREVTGPDHKPLKRYGLSVEQAFDPAPVYVLDTLLLAVLREGTGQRPYRRLPGAPALAGKTGTTDDLRDSWFAGFGADRVAVVWVGRDDNRPTGLTGADGALEVWVDLMAGLAPAAWEAAAPAGVEWRWVDPEAGYRVEEGCTGAVRLPFLTGTVLPQGSCRGGGGANPLDLLFGEG
ncbi:MAG: penicillin-binding protein 1B [Gammaproteobacteria bacterium]|nr:penicillin-binding protein 1B [Gammaproteobacteria bacterium]